MTTVIVGSSTTNSSNKILQSLSVRVFNTTAGKKRRFLSHLKKEQLALYCKDPLGANSANVTEEKLFGCCAGSVR